MALVNTDQPAPDLLLGQGEAAVRLSSLWKEAPLVVYLQVWVEDPTSPVGLSATNVVAGATR